MSIGGVVLQFSADSKRARRDIEKLTKSLQDIGSKSDTAGKKMSGMGTAGKLGIAAVAGAAAAAGLAVGRLASATVGLAADFEQSQNVLQATLKASSADMQRLADLAKEMGAETVFSAQDASDAMVELAKAGLSTAQIMGGGVQAAMALAATEGLALADAAMTTTNAMAAFGLAARDLPQVADALAGASAASTASVKSLSDGLAQVSAGAKVAGLTLQETVGILAAFDQIGIKGSDAGTSLKTMLTRLIPTTKKAQEAWESYGLATYNARNAMQALKEWGIKSNSSSLDDVTESLIAFYQARGETRPRAVVSAREFLWAEAFDNAMVNANGSMKDATEIAEALQRALGKLSEADRIEATGILFGSDAARAANALAELGAKGLKPFIDGASKTGEAARMAEARTKGFKGAVEALKGSLETVGIEVGSALLPALTGLVNYVTDTAIPTLRGLFSDDDSPDSKRLKAELRGVTRQFRIMDTFLRDNLIPTLTGDGDASLPGALATMTAAFRESSGYFVGWAAFVTRNFGYVVGAVRSMVIVVQAAVQLLLDNLARAFGWLPVVGDQIRTARDEFKAAADKTNAVLDGVAAKANAAAGSFDAMAEAMGRVNAMPAPRWAGDFTYYDPRTGRTSTSPSAARRNATSGRAGADRAGGAGGVVVNNYYPKPEKPSDSVAAALRAAKATGLVN